MVTLIIIIPIFFYLIKLKNIKDYIKRQVSAKVKKKHIAFLSIALLCMTCFIVIGYAALADNLLVDGSAEVEGKPFRGVYIKNVTLVSATNITSNKDEYILPTNHDTVVNVNRTGGSVTYKITVHNNTDVTYWYIGPRVSNDYGQNALIGQSNGITVVTKDHQNDNYGSFNSDDWIPAQTERDFFVTYTYGSNAPTVSSTLINFFFDIRMDAVHDEFLAVLNNTKTPDSYEQLIAVFNQQYSQNGDVSISTETHPQVFDALFDDLMVNIDGVERQASVTIRRENLDNDTSSGDNYSNNGPRGNEFTLYITVEPLTPGGTVTVYAIAYSKGAADMGSNWYQVGELYEGTAKVDANGEVDYSTWKATYKNYEMADGINYLVGAPNGDQYDIMNTMEQLISAEDQDIFNQIDNTNIFKKVYDIIQKHRGSNDPAVEGLRAAFYEAEKFYVNHNNGQEFKVVRNKYTRAEIIYAIKNIQMALDYYYQAYPQ